MICRKSLSYNAIGSFVLSLIIIAKQKSGGCHGRVSSTIFLFPNWKCRLSPFVFLTVAYYLEHREWGSRLPIIMNEVYQGYLLPERAEQVREELSVIVAEPQKLKPHQIYLGYRWLVKRASVGGISVKR